MFKLFPLNLLAALSLLLFTLTLQPAAAIEPDPFLQYIPWDDRTWEQRALQSTYDDQFNPEHDMIVVQDPFTWVVSRPFAERFGMPERYVDDALKGALALAWRVSDIGYTFCGYISQPDLCQKPFTCQMDIYVDSAAPIPWNFDDVRSDFFWYGLSSYDLVPGRLPAPRRYRYQHEANFKIGKKGQPVHHIGWVRSPDNYSGAFDLVYFDRDFAPGVSLLGYNMACPDPDMKDPLYLPFFTDEERIRTRGHIKNYAHTIHFPTRFMNTIRGLHQEAEAAHREKSAFYQEQMRRLFPSADEPQPKNSCQ